MGLRISGWTMLAAAALVGGGAAHLGAQTWERGDQEWCAESRGSRDRDRACEVLVTTLASTGLLDVDGGANGGVSVLAWDRDEVRVEARVWADARSPERAEELARAVELLAARGRVDSEGPRTGRRESWGVSWEIRVPRDSDIEVRTVNGGIRVEDVAGAIEFRATNGGVRVTGAGGDVRGHTTNGGLHVALSGDRAPAGVDVSTTNGGVTVVIPEGYSAELVAGTRNGGIDVDFPVTVRGRIGRELRTTLGDGGPTIRAVTTNGHVRIRRP